MAVDTKETLETIGDAQRLLKSIVSSTSLCFWHFCTICMGVKNRLQDYTVNVHEVSKDLRVL